MTGKLVKGKGFRGALRYNLDKVERKVAEVLESTFARSGEHAILKEVQMVRSLRPRLEKYFYHTSINFPPEETLSSDIMKRIGLDYLDAMGLVNNQFIMFRHFDADHPHIHILVNRIDHNGSVRSDSNDYQQTEKILRSLEIKYHLRQVHSSRQTTERPVTKDELEMMKRTNAPSSKMKLQVAIKRALQSKPTLQQFILRLESQGIAVLFNQASTGYVSGISYQLNSLIITGGKLGSDFKWTSIQNKINYEQERDRQRIHEANIRARATGAAAGVNPKDYRRAGGNSSADNRKYPQDQNGGKDHLPLYKGAAGKHSSDKSSHPSDYRPDDKADSGKNENPQGLDLAALLDSYSFRDFVNPSDQPYADPPSMNPYKKKRRKRRSGR
ncbi:MAG: relaxase/mobilization nuclease domain-containing protein [Cyclobacteriaceae bacterium]|nr:relaxase/mobilization nuclease domain-containing protein [Cyclobacteriaceae bacterium]